MSDKMTPRTLKDIEHAGPEKLIQKRFISPMIERFDLLVMVQEWIDSIQENIDKIQKDDINHAIGKSQITTIKVMFNLD